MNLKIRAATIYDSDGVERLLHSSGPEMYDFIYSHDGATALEYIKYEFLSGDGFCGYKYLTVAEIDGEVVGIASFYTQSMHLKMSRGTVKNVLAFYGDLPGLDVLSKAQHVGSVMRCPGDSEVYIANLGVRPDFRGSGVGSQLLNAKKQEAIDNKYKLMSLDVAVANSNAQKLYERLGFIVVEPNKIFSGCTGGSFSTNGMVLELG